MSGDTARDPKTPRRDEHGEPLGMIDCMLNGGRVVGYIIANGAEVLDIYSECRHGRSMGVCTWRECVIKGGKVGAKCFVEIF